jgi:hypothetical protein
VNLHGWRLTHPLIPDQRPPDRVQVHAVDPPALGFLGGHDLPLLTYPQFQCQPDALFPSSKSLQKSGVTTMRTDPFSTVTKSTSLVALI